MVESYGRAGQVLSTEESQRAETLSRESIPTYREFQMDSANTYEAVCCRAYYWS